MKIVEGYERGYIIEIVVHYGRCYEKSYWDEIVFMERNEN